MLFVLMLTAKIDKKMKDELEKLPLIKLGFTVPYDFFFSPWIRV